ncbi:photosynthetic complex assembly protein PuhC [Aestuariivita sp.]|jgi:putative photosynthetic complex assembly protein|uniref:photosynthetic complex assembly protein PuhC n=1 Tax=Aestuariivita sp. TaxID=1872407 RepID=UPI0021731C72|nr:photosynthetic complex assembly protein PuhC [Aestuariivita sp.]MCE8009710.1 pullulanase [Aestuariivita sp.]
MSDNTSDTPHLRHKEVEIVPIFMVRAMFALVVVCLVLVSAARITGRPLEATPANTPVIAERAIYLSGDTSGAALVLDANGSVLADLPGEEGGFIAGVQRVIDRERNKHGVPLTAPVLLQLREGHRLSITDPSTGWSAELMGFGATNFRSFARLLDPS